MKKQPIARVTVCLRECSFLPEVIFVTPQGTRTINRQGPCHAMTYEGACARNLQSMPSSITCDVHGRRILAIPEGALPRPAEGPRAS